MYPRSKDQQSTLIFRGSNIGPSFRLKPNSSLPHVLLQEVRKITTVPYNLPPFFCEINLETESRICRIAPESLDLIEEEVALCRVDVCFVFVAFAVKEYFP
ncbi:hypothetical protein HG531_008950 [Fusarium graminearum]|nr:hypothetical protein HG531_008950 [Fusarium graminearum]